jgi:putative restriction endonuclease
MTVNQPERAFRAWTILTDRAARGLTITYGDLGTALAIHHRTVRYVLGLIQSYCLDESLPPLTILIVNKSGLPGTGFIALDLARFAEGKEHVFRFPWSTIENPFQYAADDTRYSELVDTIATDPQASEEILRLVKVRGIAQRLFRSALLKVYRSSCAFTGISFETSLEACHLLPWQECSASQRLDVRNGILLNAFHHKLFDNGFVTIQPNHRIRYYDPDEKKSRHTDIERSLTVALHGKTMRMPKNAAAAPSAEYIALSHDYHGW